MKYDKSMATKFVAAEIILIAFVPAFLIWLGMYLNDPLVAYALYVSAGLVVRGFVGIIWDIKTALEI